MSGKHKGKIEYQRVDVGGTCVNFPFTPYDIQIDYMRKVLECLDNSQHGLLESPTGTGKTLSLLCSSLAWLEKNKASAQLAARYAQMSGEAGSGEVPALPTRYKVIYSSRTHSQLSQAVAELGRTSYRSVDIYIKIYLTRVSLIYLLLKHDRMNLHPFLQVHESGHTGLKGPALCHPCRYGGQQQ